jgi:hypothetical protein
MHSAWQDAVADKLAARWRCQWKGMGPYCPFDVYMMRDKKILSLVEIRTRRDKTHDAYPVVMLDLDKWYVLVGAELGFHKRAARRALRPGRKLAGIYVNAFSDGIWFVRIGDLPVNEFSVMYRGRTDRPESPNDRSPVIEIPVEHFRLACPSDGVFEANGADEYRA